MSTVPIYAAAERLEPPAVLSREEAAVWRAVVASRRPGWFSGSETLLQSFCVQTAYCQRIEGELRGAAPGTILRHTALLRAHRQTVAQCASLARLLRLAVNTRLDRNQRHDGDEPLREAPPPEDWRRQFPHAVPDGDDLCSADGERDFSLLRARAFGYALEPARPSETPAAALCVATEGADVAAFAICKKAQSSRQ